MKKYLHLPVMLIILSTFVHAALTNGLILYAPFEDNADPVVYQGQKILEKQSVTFAPGKAGNCAVLDQTPVSMPVLKNIQPKAGTVSFWIHLDAAVSELAGNTDFFFGTDHIRLNYQPGRKVLFYMTGTTIKGKGFAWNYADYKGINDWKAGDWHHVAIAWDTEAKHKWMWVDGKKVIDIDTELLNPGYTGNKVMTIGAKGLSLRVDEWCIWDRVLDDGEIAGVIGGGVNTATVTRTTEKALFPLAFTLAMFKDDPSASIVEPGGTCTLTFTVKNRSAAPYRGTHDAVLIDIHGAERMKVPFTLDLAPDASTTVALGFSSTDKGVFKAVTVISGAKRDLGSFAVIPRNITSTSNRDSFFGNHVNSWSGPMIDQAARLGQNWMRGHNMLQSTWWQRVQPEPGAFIWSHDFQLSNVQRYSMPVLGQFFGVPYWASQRPAPKAGKSEYPKPYVPRWDAFGEYVYETVKHFSPYIRYWETGNEPEVSMFWNGTPADFAEYCRVAYESAKKADPDCVVMMGGSTTPPWAWHEESAKAGAYKYCDVISIHLSYGSPRTPFSRFEKESKAIIDHFNEMCVKYGKGKPLPMWTSEGGTTDTPWLFDIDYDKAKAMDALPDQIHALAGASAVAKGEMLIQALGFEKHFFYYQNIPGGPSVFEDTGMLEFTYAPRPKLVARVILASMLEGLIPLGKYIHNEETGLWAFFWKKPSSDKSLVAVFCDEGGKMNLDGIPDARVFDIMGNQKQDGVLAVTDEPVYLKLNMTAEKAYDVFKNIRPSIIVKASVTQTVSAEDKPAVPVLPGFVAPTEGSSEKIVQIDLKPFCTMGFADEKAGDGIGGWGDEGPFNDMRDFPLGMLYYYNVPFRIIDPRENNGRSVITLKSANITPNQPSEVRGIPVGRKVRALYFLHAAAWGTPGNAGSYVINYTDGSRETIPLDVPRTIHNWWNGYDPKEITRPVPIRVSNTATGKPAWRYVRVLEWENKKNDVPVASVDFISAGKVQAPILVALTALSW